MINRHNYEEFFLMYVDNELTPQQRAEVELFVTQNPDLETEFYLLRQTKLSPDEMLEFGHKADLLKIKDSIGIDNYEEYFLLYVDGELNEESKEAVEKFVLQQPQLQDEFTLLKQTTLPQEKIVFTDKKSLYRKEPGRVVYFSWMRVAVAAAFIGIAAGVWWLLPGKETNNVVVRHLAKENVKSAQKDQQSRPEQSLTQSSTTQDKQIAATDKRAITAEKKATVQTNKKNINQPSKQKNAEESNLASNNQKNNKSNISSQQENVSGIDEIAKIDNNDVVAISDNKKNDETALKNAKLMQVANHNESNNNLVKPAVYKELNTDDEYDNRGTLYVGSLELNKNKMRGIMKKVGGMFAGKSKSILTNDEGKLQVANLQLNTN